MAFHFSGGLKAQEDPVIIEVRETLKAQESLQGGWLK